jgi:hypothetical protein
MGDIQATQSTQLREIELIIDDLEIAGSRDFIEAGMHWRMIKESNLWKSSGSHIKSFADYIRDRGRKVATVYNQILIATALEGFTLKGCDYTKLLEVARVKRRWEISKEQTEQLIEDIKLLPYNGLKDNIRNIIGLKATDECEHLELEAWNKCKTCHKWLKEG